MWLLPLTGGEPRRVTSLLNGVSGFQWSPDGAQAGRRQPQRSERRREVAERRAPLPHANYKFNDTGWFDDKRAHLWAVDVATGRATQLTSGDDWNDADPQWSPDSRKIAFVSDRTGKAFDEGHNTDVWVIDANGGPLTKISDHTERRQLAALVARRPDDRVRQLGAGEVAPEDLAGAQHRRRASRLAADGVDLIPGGAALGRRRPRALFRDRRARARASSFASISRRDGRRPVTSGDRTVRFVDVTTRRIGSPTPSTIRRTSTTSTSPIWMAATRIN